jgi:hypothetical protein
LPRRTPLSRAENPPIAFICELKKQVRIGLVLLGEGQSAISDRAGAAHGTSNPNATERGFKYRKKGLVRGRPLARCAIEGIARHPYGPQFPDSPAGSVDSAKGGPKLRRPYLLWRFSSFAKSDRKSASACFPANCAAPSDRNPSPVILMPNGFLLRRISQLQRSGF